ncbi:MAG: glyoxylase-like metal-dependent hydrolase (beta-lactamase superfamily II) [Pseudohongiellaceae bacterium]|jgi:glyoxylase-like metal-dependent hydrolase (beta-lactamase superfamily II)
MVLVKNVCAVGLALCLSYCGVDADPSAGNEFVPARDEGQDNWWDSLPRAAWLQFPKVAVEQGEDWFQVYRISDGVYGIYEDGQLEEVISYLIVGDASALLFDTGIGVGDIASIVAQLTELPVAVLNSHSHYDHVGGNHFFAKIYGTGLEYSQQRSKGRANAQVAEFISEGWVWKPLPAGTTVSNYTSKPFTVTDFVSDSQVIDLGGRVLEVILVPGHTPDALVLLDRDNRLMFMGDTFYPATLYAHTGDANFLDYVSSAEKLSQYQFSVDYILPAHNEPLIPSYYLKAMRDAFVAIQAPNAPFMLSDGDREYEFEGFSIMVSDPPPWD